MKMMVSPSLALLTLLGLGPAEAAAAPVVEPAAPVQAPKDPSPAMASPQTPAPAPTETAPTETAPTETAPSETAAASPATTPDPKPAADASAESDDPPPRRHTRLVLAVGPMVGPHALGNEECKAEEQRCEKKGSFFGAGAQIELRARLYRVLYLHLRGMVVSNVSPNDRIYSGVTGGGVGLGAYGRRIFGRAEYLLVGPFGDNRFEPPFYDGDVARDEWGNHAGMLAVGFRQPLPRGLAIELWGGPMFGPRSVRTVPQVEPDERVLITFQLGLNLSWDAWK